MNPTSEKRVTKEGEANMDKILFEQLTQSIHQMNEIMEGTRHPSRTFHIDAMKIKKNPSGYGIVAV